MRIDVTYPRRSGTTHTEQLGDDASVYDWARAHVHALNPTAARVWRQCDGATSPAAMAADLARGGVPEPQAVVDLTLAELTRLHLLEPPVEHDLESPARSRRWLLSRGVAAAMLPAIASIVAPTPLAAQSPQLRPTLTSVVPPQGRQATTVAVTLTGTHFVMGGTAVTLTGTGVTLTGLTVTTSTSLTANFVLDAAAAPGARSVTVTTAAGTSNSQSFTIEAATLGAPSVAS